METNIHRCKEMPQHLYIKHSKWAGGWSLYSERLNHANMWSGISYCPYCGKDLLEIPTQISF